LNIEIAPFDVIRPRLTIKDLTAQNLRIGDKVSNALAVYMLSSRASGMTKENLAFEGAIGELLQHCQHRRDTNPRTEKHNGA